MISISINVMTAAVLSSVSAVYVFVRTWLSTTQTQLSYSYSREESAFIQTTSAHFKHHILDQPFAEHAQNCSRCARAHTFQTPVAPPEPRHSWNTTGARIYTLRTRPHREVRVARQGKPIALTSWNLGFSVTTSLSSLCVSEGRPSPVT